MTNACPYSTAGIKVFCNNLSNKLSFCRIVWYNKIILIIRSSSVRKLYLFFISFNIEILYLYCSTKSSEKIKFSYNDI